MANRSGWKFAAAMLVVSVLFTLTIVQYSMRHGRLLTVPFFDDITYFRDGLSRLANFYTGGFAAVAGEYWHTPPHSPFSTLLAMLSFALLGVHDWAPYFGNVVIVYALLLFVGAQVAELRVWERVCCIALALTFPLTSQSVFEFRPDIACGLLNAMGVALLLRQSLGRSSLRYKLGIGACFGGAMLAKPSMIIFTLALFGGALWMTTLCDWLIERRPLRIKQIARNWWPVIAAAGVLAFPHYAIDGKAIAYYIYMGTFGATADAFASTEPKTTQLLYHLSGKGGEAMLGNHLYILLAVGVVGFAWAFIAGRRALVVRGLAYFVMLLLAFAIPAVHIEKQMFFAATFDVMLLFGAVLVLHQLLKHQSVTQFGYKVVRGLFVPTLFISCLLCVKLPKSWGTARDVELVSRSRLAVQLADTLMKSATESKPIVFFTSTGYINADLIGYLCLQAGDGRFAFTEAPLTREPDLFTTFLDTADFVIASESGTTEVFTYMPSGLIQDQTLAMIRSRSDFREIVAFPTANGRRYFLFGKNIPFFGWEEISGLGLLEGPYPQWHLPKIRWGVAPATRLAIQSATGGKMRLVMECAAAVADTSVIILLDGQELRQEAVAPNGVYSTIDQPFDVSAGRHVLELRYTKWDQENPVMLRAIIFKKLQVFQQ